MEWKEWKGKKIFVQLKSGAFYSGKVEDVNEDSKPLIFFTITDKFGATITFVHSEIIKIVEEEDNGNSK